jgi:hypothetical protein
MDLVIIDPQGIVQVIVEVKAAKVGHNKGALR